MHKVPVYLVIKRTGQVARDGEELYIVFDAKLTRSAADQVVVNNPGTEVKKLIADKEA